MNLEPILKELINNISQKNAYGGNKISKSIMDMFEIEIRSSGDGGILVPYWIAILQKGRGPRKRAKDYELHKIIYKWMQRRNMFRSKTAAGKINEAKSLTWYINTYGTKQFRKGAFIDVYTKERTRTIERINKEYANEISKITMEIL